MSASPTRDTRRKRGARAGFACRTWPRRSSRFPALPSNSRRGPATHHQPHLQARRRSRRNRRRPGRPAATRASAAQAKSTPVRPHDPTARHCLGVRSRSYPRGISTTSHPATWPRRPLGPRISVSDGRAGLSTATTAQQVSRSGTSRAPLFATRTSLSVRRPLPTGTSERSRWRGHKVCRPE